MGTIYSPKDLGFSNEKHVIDRCQIALLRAVSQAASNRLVVKGGMAMRVAFGSMRLTQDIDFDRTANMSGSAVKGLIRNGMHIAAQLAGIRELAIDVTKDTQTTVRIRMSGATHNGISIRFQVETSGRAAPHPEEIQQVNVIPPINYALSPFQAQVYSLNAMAAAKVQAVLADLRNVPRDVADLKTLIAFGANPVTILSQSPVAQLQALRHDVLGKLAQIHYDMAVQELFPYLPPAEANAITQAQWEDDALTISTTIDQWLNQALALREHAAQTSSGAATP